MRKGIFLAAFFMVLIILCGPAMAQKKAQILTDLDRCEVGEKVYVYLYDGSTIIGELTEKGENEIKVTTDVGDMTIPLLKIEKLSREAIEPYEKPRRFSNPNYTRLFFAPNGRTLKAGEGYFSDIYVLFPSIAYGLTDNITLGAGVSIIPGLGFGNQILFFTPKVGFNVGPKVSLSVGSFIMRFPVDFDLDEEEEDSEWIGMLFGMSTFGTLDHSVTVGLGYGFVNDEMAEKPLVIIGGEARLSQGIALVSENWVLPGVDEEVISYGIRFFGRKLSIDLAMIATIEESFNFPGFPYIDFVVNF